MVDHHWCYMILVKEDLNFNQSSLSFCTVGHYPLSIISIQTDSQQSMEGIVGMESMEALSWKELASEAEVEFPEVSWPVPSIYRWSTSSLSSPDRPERCIVTIASLNQWLATIEKDRHQWLTEKPSKNHWSQWLSRYHSINGNGHLNNH